MSANNIEAMGFEKSGWSLIEETDGQPRIIYMGKPTNPDAETSDKCWVIRKITITENSESRLTETKKAEGYNSWDDRKDLDYKY